MSLKFIRSSYRINFWITYTAVPGNGWQF